MPLWNDEQMQRCLRMNVRKCQHFVVLVSQLRWQLTGHDPAEQTILRCLAHDAPPSDNSVNNDFGFWNGGVVTNPITLAWFRAEDLGSGVRFEWMTATETGNVGFNVYAVGDSAVKVLAVDGKVVRQSSKFHAHDEQNDAHLGDTVRIVETRPLSKTKRWRVTDVLERAK